MNIFDRLGAIIAIEREVSLHDFIATGSRGGEPRRIVEGERAVSRA